MTNERLRAQLVANGLAPADLAERVCVDPKTVDRWIDKDDRIPYPTIRQQGCPGSRGDRGVPVARDS